MGDFGASVATPSGYVEALHTLRPQTTQGLGTKIIKSACIKLLYKLINDEANYHVDIKMYQKRSRITSALQKYHPDKTKIKFNVTHNKKSRPGLE